MKEETPFGPLITFLAKPHKEINDLLKIFPQVKVYSSRSLAQWQNINFTFWQKLFNLITIYLARWFYLTAFKGDADS